MLSFKIVSGFHCPLVCCLLTMLMGNPGKDGLVLAQSWDRVHPQQVCRWHQAEWCSWHPRSMGCHPEGNGQSSRSGPVWMSWGSTRPSARSCIWVRAAPAIDTDWGMKGLRAALLRRTWGYWWM